jgi:hypothetical protein
MLVEGALGLAGAALSLVYWFLVAKRGHERFRLYCERRFDVRITFGSRGHWRVEGKGSWLRRVGIESLELAYFMAAFVVWAAAMSFVLLAIALIEELPSSWA